MFAVPTTTNIAVGHAGLCANLRFPVPKKSGSGLEDVKFIWGVKVRRFTRANGKICVIVPLSGWSVACQK